MTGTAHVSPSPLVDVVVPVLARPHRIRPLLHDIAVSMRHYPKAVAVTFVVDPDDHRTIEACAEAGADWLTDWSMHPTYASKINEGAAQGHAAWVLTAADDLHFHRGWFGAAMATHRATGALVIGTNDLANRRVVAGEHSTHTLIARSYINDPGGCVDTGPGSVMHAGYPHEYCDDELIETARARGVFAHSARCVLEHLHPMVGKGDDDATYRRGRSTRARSREIYEARRHLWT
jgi:hypothetical protein